MPGADPEAGHLAAVAERAGRGEAIRLARVSWMHSSKTAIRSVVPE
jgi:hypothetical protein